MLVQIHGVPGTKGINQRPIKSTNMLGNWFRYSQCFANNEVLVQIHGGPGINGLNPRLIKSNNMLDNWFCYPTKATFQQPVFSDQERLNKAEQKTK